MPENPVSCDIVIPVYDQVHYTQACVESIFAHTPLRFKIIIVDDASKESVTADYLKHLQETESSRVIVLRHEQNSGYVGSVNDGLARTNSPYVVVMNNDTVAYPGWLSEMIAVASQDETIGLVNPQWEIPKGFQGGVDAYVARHIVPQKGRSIEIDWARGFCYLVKREVINAIGGLDKDFAPAYYDDWDYSLRAGQAGWRCVLALGAFVFHVRNVTYGADDQQGRLSTLLEEKGRIFYQRWGKPLRMLVVDNGNCFDLGTKLSQWLKGQNKITLVSSGEGDTRHTNLRVIKVPRVLRGLAGRWLVFLNALHSKPKRYHLVCDAGDPGVDQLISKLKFS